MDTQEIIHHFHFNRKEFSDFKIICNNKFIYCNKQILKQHSKYFKSLFETFNDIDDIEINNFKYKHLFKIIKLCYVDEDSRSVYIHELKLINNFHIEFLLISNYLMIDLIIENFISKDYLIVNSNNTINIAETMYYKNDLYHLPQFKSYYDILFCMHFLNSYYHFPEYTDEEIENIGNSYIFVIIGYGHSLNTKNYEKLQKLFNSNKKIKYIRFSGLIKFNDIKQIINQNDISCIYCKKNIITNDVGGMLCHNTLPICHHICFCNKKY